MEKSNVEPAVTNPKVSVGEKRSWEKWLGDRVLSVDAFMRQTRLDNQTSSKQKRRVYDLIDDKHNAIGARVFLYTYILHPRIFSSM